MELVEIVIGGIIPNLNWREPRTASQGEEEYAVIYDSVEQSAVLEYLRGRTEFEMPGDLEHFYRVLPSSFNEYDLLVYKIRFK